MNQIITNFSDEEILIDKNKNSCFLAGPTRRNSPYNLSWRKEAVEILRKLNFEGIIYIPECIHSIQFDYNNQVLWERKGLENANHIIFWIPRNMIDMPALTTNVEFGMYLARNPEKVFYGRPDNSEKNTYLDWLYNYETNRFPINNLENLLKLTV